jgi:hypothetical protein
MAHIVYLDVEELADELDELRDRFVDDEEIDEDRLRELTQLERELGGDLHIAGRDRGPFISDTTFEEYAIELAEDIGPKMDGWPYDYIDWERAADALKQDFYNVDFEGETYWYRA